MNIQGLALAEKLRHVASDTENPERAGIMIQAADEITSLIEEIRRIESARTAKAPKS
jgi:hypothetical protein